MPLLLDENAFEAPLKEMPYPPYVLYFPDEPGRLLCAPSRDLSAKTDTIADSTNINDTGVLFRTPGSQQRVLFQLSGGTPCGRVLPAQPASGEAQEGAGRLRRTPSSGGGAMAWPVRYRIIG